MISSRLPREILPLGRRLVRGLDQLRGYPFSKKRRGVVLMLHVGRCGSTVLANMLAQNPEVYWDGKIHRKAQRLYGEKIKTLDHVRWTKQQFSISGGRYYGFEFKMLPDQYSAIFGTTPKDFLTACKAIGVTHYILLRRSNTLRHVISHYASKRRGNWHISPDDEVRAQQFKIDCDRIATGSAEGRPLVDYLQEVESTYREVEEILNDQELLAIEYEADIEAHGAQVAYEKICDFLNITATSVSIKNKKVNPFAPEQIIENYDEIVGRLTETPFEWMLNNELTPCDT